VSPMSLLRHLTLERALLLAFGVSAALLAGAHAFELAGYPPCDLCLEQREVHWLAGGVAIAGFVAAAALKQRAVALAGLGVVGLIYIGSVWLAGYHAGVEYGFWQGPAGCSGFAGDGEGDMADVLAAISNPNQGVACDEAPWTLIGISMAGYNALISLGLAAVTLFTAIRTYRREKSQSL